MKWLKLFEDFKQNNEEGDLLKQEDIIKCIEKGGIMYATIVQEIPDNDPTFTTYLRRITSGAFIEKRSARTSSSPDSIMSALSESTRQTARLADTMLNGS